MVFSLYKRHKKLVKSTLLANTAFLCECFHMILDYKLSISLKIAHHSTTLSIPYKKLQ